MISEAITKLTLSNALQEVVATNGSLEYVFKDEPKKKNYTQKITVSCF